MATELVDLVDGLKREVAVPGTFSQVYASTTDADLVGSLMDAFAEAKLDGFFSGYELDVNGQYIEPSLSHAGEALVRIYAAERILLSQIANLKNRAVYEAGPVKYETETSASVLAGILKALADRKRRLLDGFNATRVYGQDMFADRLAGVEIV